MIVSFSRKFVYLRTIKVASSSLEFYFSQFCNKDDIITSLDPAEEKIKKKLGLLTKQNEKYKKFSLSLKNLFKLRFFHNKRIHEHSSADILFKTNIHKKINNFFYFTFVRNPYDWIVSYFWWNLHYHNNKSLKYINKLSQKKIQLLFKKFLNDECGKFFFSNKNIISSNYVKINVFKLEKLNQSIFKIKKKLHLKDENFEISRIKFKSLKIKKKIIFDNEDRDIVLNNADFFFKKFKYPEKLQAKYKIKKKGSKNCPL